MVCERNTDSPYDAEKGRIHIVRDGDYLRAEGTTLGADNGIGVATMLHVAEAQNVSHGPIELLFTVDEETGLVGAKNVDPALLRGRTLINLDSEDDGILYVGCAGGCTSRLRWTAPEQSVPMGWMGAKIVVSGLQGGHSGVDIQKNRLNAVRALTRVLQEVGEQVPVMLADIHGGNMHNAIPRECVATIMHPSSGLVALRKAIQKASHALETQYSNLETGLAVVVEDHKLAADSPVFSPESTSVLLSLLRALPSGPIAMSQDIPGLVETSSNLAVVRSSGNAVEIYCHSRSSVAPALRDVLETVRAVARLAGATCDEQDGYPGWKPDLSSPVLGVTKRLYRKRFGRDPIVTAVHAGLECGMLGEQCPGIDMVSFGPQIEGAHAPGERVSIPSVAKSWDLLLAVLDELSQPGSRTVVPA
jgi:dipeptidase D